MKSPLPELRSKGASALLLLLCLLSFEVIGHPPAPGDDTLKARLKACLVAGDMACVVDQYLLLKDVGRMPGWLVAFQNAFALANRKAGECEKVARTVYEGLTRLGQKPEVIRFTVKGDAKLLGFNEMARGVLVRSHQVALTGQHVAIKWEGKVIDAYTGLGGLPVSEYMTRLGTAATSHVVYEVTSTP